MCLSTPYADPWICAVERSLYDGMTCMTIYYTYRKLNSYELSPVVWFCKGCKMTYNSGHGIAPNRMQASVELI